MFGFFKRNKKDSLELVLEAEQSRDAKEIVNLLSEAIKAEKAKSTPDKIMLSDIYQKRGSIYYQLQVAILSSSDFMHALEMNPDNAQANNDLGMWFNTPAFAPPEYAKAIQYFEKAVELNPNELDYRMNLAVTRIESGDKEKGRQELENLVAKGHQNARIAIARFL